MGFSLLCVDVGYKQWSNDRPLCAFFYQRRVDSIDQVELWTP